MTETNEQQHAMNTPTYTLNSTNFDHAPTAFPSFKEAVDAAKERGFEAHITDGMGEVLATWSAVYGLRMKPNRYSL